MDMVHDITAEIFLPVMRTNALGPALITQAFLPLVQRSPSRKVIMNMSSSVGSVGYLWGQHKSTAGAAALSYSMSKAALNMLVRIRSPSRVEHT